MECPYCKGNMIKGRIYQDRYAIKWIPGDQEKTGLFTHPFEKGIKLTSFPEVSSIEVYYCEPCGKFIFDKGKFDL